jgi:hypothetical protein
MLVAKALVANEKPNFWILRPKPWRLQLHCRQLVRLSYIGGSSTLQVQGRQHGPRVLFKTALSNERADGVVEASTAWARLWYRITSGCTITNPATSLYTDGIDSLPNLVASGLERENNL